MINLDPVASSHTMGQNIHYCTWLVWLANHDLRQHGKLFPSLELGLVGEP